VTADGRRTFAGDRRRAVALPLGGIGTGNLALGGTEALKQWQLHNQGNHLGFAPQSFFALRLSCTEPPLSFRRVLRGPEIAPHPEPAPLVNDDLDAAGRTTHFPRRKAIRVSDWRHFEHSSIQCASCHAAPGSGLSAGERTGIGSLVHFHDIRRCHAGGCEELP
jgi:hypothetical protein